ncbi:SIMPL domain-containing protein [Roseiconus nitratireducens]|nr:SIMPL domain-containing protein [Roseiconus nitratireducens]
MLGKYLPRTASDTAPARPASVPPLATAIGFSSLIVAAILTFPASAFGQEQEIDDLPSISVSGEGEVQSKPDMAAISVGVVTEAESAKQALEANNEAMQRLFESLDQMQIEDKDRQTVRFDISPQYRREDPRRQQLQQDDASRQPRIVGYQVTNQLRIKVRRISELGNVLDAVVAAGSNRVEGIQFAVDNQDNLLDEARKAAIEDARRKAQLFAKAADVSLGRVLRIQERGGAQPVGGPRMMMMAEGRSTPIASGEQTISAQVDVVFGLKESR